MTGPDGEVVFTRVLPATRDLVFRCLTEAEHLAMFWGPIGVRAPLDGIVIEPRAGGRFEVLMVNDADGSRYVMRAVFEEVRPPERLVWTDIDHGMTTTATLVDLGEGRTEAEIRQRHAPAAFLDPDAQAGFLTSLDRFAEHLARLQKEGWDPR